MLVQLGKLLTPRTHSKAENVLVPRRENSPGSDQINLSFALCWEPVLESWILDIHLGFSKDPLRFGIIEMLVSKRYIWRPSHYWLSELAKYRTLDAGIRKSHWEVQISQNSVSDEEIVESLDHAASKVVQNFVFVPRCSRQWPGGRRTQPATASSLPLSLLAYRSRSSIPTCSIRSRPLASLLDTINLDNLAQVHTVLCLLEAHISILTPRSCTWTPLAMLLVEHWQSSSLPMLITGVRSSFTEHSHLVLQTVARSQWLTKRNRQETSDNHFLYCLLRSLIDPCILVKRSVGSCARFSDGNLCCILHHYAHFNRFVERIYPALYARGSC